MSDKDEMVNVSIRVPAVDWEELEGENRSEICRKALRANARSVPQPEEVDRYKKQYRSAKEELKETKATVRVKREMLFSELDAGGYDSYVLGESTQDNSRFENTIVFASQYCETYLESGMDDDSIIRRVCDDMMEEGRSLSKEVAEWIVERTKEKMDE